MRCPSLAEIPPPPQGKIGWPWTLESHQLPDSMPDGKPWPKVSIVTPSFNQGHFIEESIRSVLLQGYPNLEYIIYDGGSTDNTIEIIQRYEGWLSHWVSEKDEGQAHAINKGWSRSRGQILAWLNSDDVYASEAFGAVAKAWCEAGQPGMIYGDALATDVTLHAFKKKSMNGYSLRTMLLGKRMPQPAVFISKELFAELGPLNESLYYSLDLDYFLRAWLESGSEKYRYIPIELAYSREHPDTKCKTGGSKRLEENEEVVRRVWNKHMKNFHHSRKWRFVFAMALVDLARRHLDGGSSAKSAALYAEALRWSPRVALAMMESMARLLNRKLWRDSAQVGNGRKTRF
jgi:glycosyltransferase involved in cell wall biosynthesis